MGFLKKSKSKKGYVEQVPCATEQAENGGGGIPGHSHGGSKRNPFRLISNSKNKRASSPIEAHMIKQQQSEETVATPLSNSAESFSIKSFGTNGDGTASTSGTQSMTNKTPHLNLLQNYILDLSATNSGNGPEGSSNNAGTTEPDQVAATLALRHLFSLSEHSHPKCDQNRIHLVQSNNTNGKLVPALLHFLHRRCDPGSQEQYLALLVLNNLSVPPENKRVIGLDCGGAHLLCRMLCLDPSCHLVAIILVNLTFCKSELRTDLCSGESGIELIETLGFALQIATSYSKHANQILIKLPNVFYIDRIAPNEMMGHIADYKPFNDGALYAPPSDQLFPETARWCVSAIKNLTRADNSDLMDDGFITHLIRYGIIHVMLDIVSVDTPASAPSSHDENISEATTGDAPDVNKPSQWDINSLPDVALYAILHAAMSAPATMTQSTDLPNIIPTLSSIADYGITSGDALRNGGMGPKDMSPDAKLIQQFQCLKARMALSYLVGGAGHFGQARALGISPADESVLMIMADEAKQLVELLANTLAGRAKSGVGGYSAQAFSIKSVIYAIRCLLVTMTNQKTFASAGGTKLNALLLKCVSRHAVQNDFEAVDSQSAEYASFSLYLLSNYGFQKAFLPADMARDQVTDKIFTSYLHMEDITPAGRHASDQLLLRLKYLVMDGASASGGGTITTPPSLVSSDFELDETVLEKAHNIIVNARETGTKPCDDIFTRPILRFQPTRPGERASTSSPRKTEFPSAIIAVQQLSFGSTRVRHIDAIDDIHIANNIAKCASGVKQQSYNYQWMWKDSSASLASPARSTISLDRYGSPSSLSIANSSKVSASTGSRSSHQTGRSNRSERLAKQSQIVKSPSSLSNRRSPNLSKSISEEERHARGRSSTPRSAQGALPRTPIRTENKESQTAAADALDGDEETQRSEHPSLQNVLVQQSYTGDGEVASQSDHSSLVSNPEDVMAHYTNENNNNNDDEPMSFFGFRCGMP